MYPRIRNLIAAGVFAAGFTGVGMAASDTAAASGFSLLSSDIAEGQQLSSAQVFQGFGCEGGNRSPALNWTGAPAGTKSFAVTVYDPDAPTGSGWWHWVVVNIPSDSLALPSDAGSGEGLPVGAFQGRTDYGTIGFGGACPPPGEMHRYVFTVHALSVKTLDLDETASSALIGFMINANSLAKARITAVYNR